MCVCVSSFTISGALVSLNEDSIKVEEGTKEKKTKTKTTNEKKKTVGSRQVDLEESFVELNLVTSRASIDISISILNNLAPD